MRTFIIVIPLLVFCTAQGQRMDSFRELSDTSIVFVTCIGTSDTGASAYFSDFIQGGGARLHAFTDRRTTDSVLYEFERAEVLSIVAEDSGLPSVLLRDELNQHWLAVQKRGEPGYEFIGVGPECFPNGIMRAELFRGGGRLNVVSWNVNALSISSPSCKPLTIPETGEIIALTTAGQELYWLCRSQDGAKGYSLKSVDYQGKQIKTLWTGVLSTKCSLEPRDFQLTVGNGLFAVSHFKRSETRTTLTIISLDPTLKAGSGLPPRTAVFNGQIAPIRFGPSKNLIVGACHSSDVKQEIEVAENFYLGLPVRCGLFELSLETFEDDLRIDW